MLAMRVKCAGQAAQVCPAGFQFEQACRIINQMPSFSRLVCPKWTARSLPLLRGNSSAFKVVALTAYQSLNDRQKSKDAGIDMHTGKPIRRETVLSLLALTAGEENAQNVS